MISRPRIRFDRFLRFTTLIVLLVALFGLRRSTAALQQAPGSSGSARPSFVEGRVLVRFHPNVDEGRVLGQFGASIERHIDSIGVHVLKLPAGRAADAVAQAMNNHPDVEFAEVDSLIPAASIPNDPYYKSQWHLPRIQAPAAWNTTVGDSGLIVAIIDTGVDGTHPDLASKMVPGWNFYDNNSNTSDIEGHGTATAGTVAAIGNNGTGVSGVIWNCLIMPIRISDPTSNATYSAAASAITYAADHGARVANMSYAMYMSSTVLSAAKYFQSKNGGGVLAMSSGNSGGPWSSSWTSSALVVGATDPNDNLSYYSTTGAMVSLTAPGDSIYTTANGGGYRYGTGTSFSSSIVAGVAALLFSVNPKLTGVQVQNILEKTADDLGPAGWDSSFGYGRVNAANAVAMALSSSSTTPTPTSSPTVNFSSPLNGSIISGTSVIQVSAFRAGSHSIHRSHQGDTAADFRHIWTRRYCRQRGFRTGAGISQNDGRASICSRQG